jgi:hydroxymethylpyrimidine/phosphomethylpyrimidine kinase
VTVAALTIAGSDTGAAAGIQADLLTFAACGVYGTTAITALTAQNPGGISGVHPVPSDFVRAQIDQVLAYYPVRALKTGMLATAAIVDTVAACLASRPSLPAVIDPVMVATSGSLLLDPAALAALTQGLLPRAALITPNFDEAAVLLGHRPGVTPAALEAAALALANAFGVPVLLKGGHVPADPVVDLLAVPSGILARFSAPRIHDVDTHGGGCTLSAAITAHLALGCGLVEAVARAHAGLRRAFANPLVLSGRKFLNHAALAG